jgi:hypothetical protein
VALAATLGRVRNIENEPMKKRTTATLVFSSALITSACGSPMKLPDIQQNPDAKMRYEITVTIDGAPGPFESVQAIAQYDVANDRCVPLTPGSGATIAPDKSVPITLTKTGENTYRGEVYVDLLEDADYYGLGVCHWTMSSVSMYLQHQKLTFPPSISLANIIAQKSETRYFNKRSYEQADTQRVDTGNPTRADFKSEADNTFSVSMSARENFK